MDLQHNVFWKISLSNGESFYEGKGKFKEIPNSDSPWQRLQQYLTSNKLDITSLGLYTNQGQTFNLPSLGKNPKFRAFDMASKPESYRFFRVLSQDISSGNVLSSDCFAVVEAVFADYKLQLWVDNENIKSCWVLAVNK